MLTEWSSHAGKTTSNDWGEERAAPVQLNHRSPIYWVGPKEANQGASPSVTQSKSPRQVQVAGQLLDLMHHVAQASGLSPNEAWSDAAQSWIAQRQCDMQELASPNGRELATAVKRVWSTIDEQLRDLREDKVR